MATKKYVRTLSVFGLDGEPLFSGALYSMDTVDGVMYADTEHGQHAFTIRNILRWRVWDKIELKGRV